MTQCAFPDARCPTLAALASGHIEAADGLYEFYVVTPGGPDAREDDRS